MASLDRSAMATNGEQLLYSTSCTPTSFHLFSKLPNHLRVLILSYAASTPRTRFIEHYGFSSPGFNPRIRYIPRLPALFAVSRETRDFSVALEGGTLAHLFAISKPENTFYINFEQDILFLSSRFTPSGRSTETSRLRELSSLLKPTFLSQVRRIVVTYSSLDHFSNSSIGEVLLDYYSLETLYVAMYDWWSDKAVRTKLRQGRPSEGYVKFQIEAEMRVVEGEETEDEEESTEVYKIRTLGRAKRKVVECELRLHE